MFSIAPCSYQDIHRAYYGCGSTALYIHMEVIFGPQAENNLHNSISVAALLAGSLLTRLGG